jgi:hypothetical protein
VAAPLVAVGLVANRAAKIQETARPNQARIGEDLHRALSRETRRRFADVTPESGWQFEVPKSASTLEWEREQARRAAELENARRRVAAGGFLGGLYLPVIPEYVSTMRPYRIYALRQVNQ